MLEGLARHCADVLTVVNADAGLHLPTVLSNGQRDTAVLQRMTARGLTGVVLSKCYIGPTSRQGLLLGFGGFDERTLIAATRTLGQVVRQ